MSNQQQSPINLAGAFQIEGCPLTLKIGWQPKLEGRMISGEHGKKLIFGNALDSQVEFRGKSFVLQEFHFHHPSEHLVNGRRFDLEVHVVHQNLSDLSRLVLGILVEAVDDAEAAAADIAESARILEFLKDVAGEESGRTSTSPVDPFTTNPHDLLPPDAARHSFWFYEGSLTTVPYTENVSWVVFKTPIHVLQSKAGAIIKEYETHYRDIQPLERRFILDQS